LQISAVKDGESKVIPHLLTLFRTWCKKEKAHNRVMAIFLVFYIFLLLLFWLASADGSKMVVCIAQVTMPIFMLWFFYRSWKK